jgi:hypothetical protein
MQILLRDEFSILDPKNSRDLHTTNIQYKYIEFKVTWRKNKDAMNYSRNELFKVGGAYQTPRSLGRN